MLRLLGRAPRALSRRAVSVRLQEAREPYSAGLTGVDCGHYACWRWERPTSMPTCKAAFDFGFIRHRLAMHGSGVGVTCSHPNSPSVRLHCLQLSRCAIRRAKNYLQLCLFAARSCLLAAQSVPVCSEGAYLQRKRAARSVCWQRGVAYLQR